MGFSSLFLFTDETLVAVIMIDLIVLRVRAVVIISKIKHPVMIAAVISPYLNTK